MYGYGGGYGPGYGMLGGWGGGFFPFHALFGLLLLVLVIVAVVWLVRAVLRQRDAAPSPPRTVQGARVSPGLDLLDQRYARGEISREEYLQKRADVLG